MPPQTKRNADIVARAKKFIAEGANHCPAIHTRVEENQKYERGEQWSAGDIERQAAREKPAIPWSSISKVVNALANREITERYVPKAFGRSADDAGVANAIDEAARWQRDMSMTEHTESIAIRTQVGSGWGVMHKFWDPTQMDGQGLIMDEDQPIWNMLWPSRARMMNLSDRRWNVCGKWVPTDQAVAFFGDKPGAPTFFKNLGKYAVAMGENASTRLETTKTMGTPMGTYGWGEINRGFWVSQALDQVFVVEAEWIEFEKTYRAAVPTQLYNLQAFKNGQNPSIEIPQPPDPSGAPVDPIQFTQQQASQMSMTELRNLYLQLLDDTEMEVIDTQKEINQISQAYSDLTGEDFVDYRAVQRNVVKYAILTDNQVWDEGDRPYGYTYEFITGFPYEVRERIDFYGVIDITKGPQDYKNALLSGMLAQYMTSPKEQMWMEEGVVPNPQELADKIAKSSVGLIEVSDGFGAAKAAGRWGTFPAPTFPAMAPQLLQLAASGVEEALALSSVDFGTQGDLRRVSGTVVQSARTASNTIVALLFDAIRKFRKRYGLLNIKMLQHYYSPQELVRIVGEEKLEDLQNVKSWDDVNRFDIKIDEEPVGITERTELVDFLTRNGTIDRWKASGDIDFDDILDFFLPQMSESDKRRLRERRKKRDASNQQLQAAQTQLQQTQTELQILQNFLKDQPNGQMMIDQFTREYQGAQIMAQQMSQSQQPPDGQGQAQ